jgi:hypothetical protein
MPKARYHFSLGDSDDGPVGFCAEVEADSEDEALKTLQAALPEIHEMEPASDGTWRNIVYVNVYFNPNRISRADIDEKEGT